MVVGHPHAGQVAAGARVPELRGRARGVVVLAVAIEVPLVGDRVARVGVAGLVRVEVHVERRVAVGRRGADHGARCLVAGGVVQAPDAAGVVVGIEEVVAGAELQLDRTGRPGAERLDPGRAGKPVGSSLHHPDAVARVVREEERPVELGRERAGDWSERKPGDRRAASGAGLLREDLGVVPVRVDRPPHIATWVEGLAQAQVQPVVAALASHFPRSRASRSSRASPAAWGCG